MASSETLWSPPAASPPAAARLPMDEVPPSSASGAPPPGSLAAGLLATGRDDLRLGLERLPARRAGRRGGWLKPVAAALALAAVLTLAVAAWSRPGAAPPAAGTASVGDERASGSGSGAAGAAPDLESQRAAVLSAPTSHEETVAGPGGLAVSIRPVESNYTVVAGDTLESIAQRFGTTIEALVGMNNLGDRNRLSVGQKLIIP